MPGTDARHQRGRRIRGALVAGLVVVLAIVAVPVLAGLGDDSSSHGGGKTADKNDALRAVRAAVGQTIASGSYQSRFEVTNVRADQCPPGPACPGQTSEWDSYGTGTVSFDPYVSHVTTTTASTGGGRTLYVTATTVWLGGGDTTPPAGVGTPLSNFAGAVQGALGPSQGALAMISLASPGGAINLEQKAVAGATAAGEGTVDGVHVTYYDVTVDMTQLADTPDLSGEQQKTIAAALPLLQRGGYSGTTERIGVDDAGYVREVTAENHFTDGTKGVRHTVLFNFGCAPKQYAPDQVAPAVTTTLPCLPPPSTTTSTVSTTTTSTPASTTTTKVTPTSTSGPVAPSTTVTPTTAPPSTAPPTTTKQP